MKHTSGPWTFSKNSNGQRIVQAPEALEGYVIAHIGNEWTPHDVKSEANARLIASAPELLKACKEARMALNALPYINGDVEDIIQEAIEYLAKAIQRIGNSDDRSNRRSLRVSPHNS